MDTQYIYRGAPSLSLVIPRHQQLRKKCLLTVIITFIATYFPLLICEKMSRPTPGSVSNNTSRRILIRHDATLYPAIIEPRYSSNPQSVDIGHDWTCKSRCPHSVTWSSFSSLAWKGKHHRSPRQAFSPECEAVIPETKDRKGTAEARYK